MSTGPKLNPRKYNIISQSGVANRYPHPPSEGRRFSQESANGRVKLNIEEEMWRFGGTTITPRQSEQMKSEWRFNLTRVRYTTVGAVFMDRGSHDLNERDKMTHVEWGSGQGHVKAWQPAVCVRHVGECRRRLDNAVSLSTCWTISWRWPRLSRKASANVFIGRSIGSPRVRSRMSCFARNWSWRLESE